MSTDDAFFAALRELQADHRYRVMEGEELRRRLETGGESRLPLSWGGR